MQFTKMHGAGNDYVYVNGIAEPIPDRLPQLARRISDRRFGVGGDGLVLILPSGHADARMRIFNADGSEAETCGNGLRCVAKLLVDHGHCLRDEVNIETNGRVLTAWLGKLEGDTTMVRTDMGEPRLDAADIPTTLTTTRVVEQPLPLDSHQLMATCVSMSNPHCVVFVSQASDELVLGCGPRIERLAEFPNRVNVEFVEVLAPNHAKQRTWERGSGETWACGTGAAAVCVAGVLTGRTQRKLRVDLIGGSLLLEWREADNHVYLTGPATEVFSGEWPDH